VTETLKFIKFNLHKYCSHSCRELIAVAQWRIQDLRGRKTWRVRRAQTYYGGLGARIPGAKPLLRGSWGKAHLKLKHSAYHSIAYHPGSPIYTLTTGPDPTRPVMNPTHDQICCCCAMYVFSNASSEQQSVLSCINALLNLGLCARCMY